MKRNNGLLVALILMLAACGGGDDTDADDIGNVVAGQAVFSKTCFACHGPTGEGIDGLGTSLVTSQFVRDTSDADLIAYLEVGRAIDDPANTTGMAMPAKGGNMQLGTGDLADIVAYLRTINS